MPTSVPGGGSTATEKAHGEDRCPHVGPAANAWRLGGPRPDGPCDMSPPAALLLSPGGRLGARCAALRRPCPSGPRDCGEGRAENDAADRYDGAQDDRHKGKAAVDCERGDGLSLLDHARDKKAKRDPRPPYCPPAANRRGRPRGLLGYILKGTAAFRQRALPARAGAPLQESAWSQEAALINLREELRLAASREVVRQVVRLRADPVEGVDKPVSQLQGEELVHEEAKPLRSRPSPRARALDGPVVNGKGDDASAPRVTKLRGGDCDSVPLEVVDERASGRPRVTPQAVPAPHVDIAPPGIEAAPPGWHPSEPRPPSGGQGTRRIPARGSTAKGAARSGSPI